MDVPFAQRRYRNYSAREARMKREKEKEKARDAKNAKKNAENTNNNVTNAAAGGSSPQSSIAQPSGVVAQAQSASELHAALSTTLAVAVTFVATTPTSLPAATLPQTGRWTRFRLFICCLSGQYTDGHH
ncbi:hypothetical protein K503DRAFT_854595 [Rhizopogon vinicolor AM-OR11-026]|uniref:Uncharacterized protein n=1 Tax=Rhizopogon vinicolor AM-OR11-026 TaxID=1314800 RepID=A0A1B7N9K5_9AGAM|nr:hypothetical protein K503DRAFT_854595 [Rhizopogon vinicolor AM-OR11-026]